MTRGIPIPLAVLVCLLPFVAPASAAGSSPVGSWELRMTRTGWYPEQVRGALRIEKEDRGLRGEVRFRMLMNGQRIALQDIAVKGASVSFRLGGAASKVSFSGKVSRGGLAGTCDWPGCGKFPFEATRPAFVEKGARKERSLPIAAPEKAGVSEEALKALILEAFVTDTDALAVIADGKLVCERDFAGDPAPIHVMSVTKFVTAMAVAMLVDEGKIESLDERVSRFLPGWKEGKKGEVTLRHLLTHTSGLEHQESARELNSQSDRVEYARKLSVSEDPGAVYSYSNEAVALLSSVIRAAAGAPADEYVAKRLFEPLGITRYEWNRDTAGNTVTYAELRLTARDLAKIGQLALDQGKWGRKQVFPAAWIPKLATPSEREPTRGLLWRLFLEKGGKKVIGYGHTGWLGQWLVVSPEKRLVGVRLRRFKNERETKATAYEMGRFAALLGALRR